MDALGGEMGKIIDKTFIQSKMLNNSKGPAVHSLRAQADKANYSKTMRQVLQNQENLDIRQMEVTEIWQRMGRSQEYRRTQALFTAVRPLYSVRVHI